MPEFVGGLTPTRFLTATAEPGLAVQGSLGVTTATVVAVPAKVILTLVLLALATLRHGVAYAAMSEVVTLDTRPGVTQSFLLLEPGGAPKDVVILFAADEGEIGFRKTADGFEVENHGGGLTARRPMRETLRRNGFTVAVIAPPSDRTQLAPSFRISAEHAQDVHEVISYLRKRYPGELFLHGQCLSSLSVASIATRLKGEGISGLILSSPRSSGRAGAVTDFEPGIVKVPVLLVQHEEDTCPFTLFDFVGRVKAFYQNSAPKVDMITVTGGEGRVAMKQKCKNGFHAFRGVEKETAQAIASWLQNKEFPTHIAGAKQ